MNTEIINCKCKHEGQDALYGAGRRVFNRTRKNEGRTWRCTVCGAEVTRGEAEAKAKAKEAKTAAKKEEKAPARKVEKQVKRR